MKILLVGGSSVLAQALRPVLMRFAEVVTAGRIGCDIQLDLTWPADNFVLPNDLDAVINLAAHFGGQDFISMMAAEDVNVFGSLKLANACKLAGVSHLIQISSMFASLDSTSPFYNSYALSKRHSEELLKLYCNSVSLPLVILRLSQIYGDGDFFRRHQPFLYDIVDKAQNGEEIVLFGRNDALRNFIHISDVVEVIARVVQLRVDGAYDCVAQLNVPYSEVAAAAVAAFGSSSNIRFDQNQIDIPDNDFAPNDTLFKRICYFPKITLVQGLALEAARRIALL